MTSDLSFFRLLKSEVLSSYQRHFPYFQGNWKSFGTQEIQNLISVIEEHQKQRISEKWIYTHLKPENNEKLPRKDMLDILSVFCGYSGWDEFVFKNREEEKLHVPNKRRNKKYLALAALIPIFIMLYLVFENKSEKQLKIKDIFTGETIDSKEVRVFRISDSGRIPVDIIDSKIVVNTADKGKVVVESPFYRRQEVEVGTSGSNAEILLQPDDYAMMLKGFMKSDIKDWETRKLQLDKILSDDLEVIVMLKGNLGAEYFNKPEFAQKLIIPTASLKLMNIIEIRYDESKKISFIRINQEK